MSASAESLAYDAPIAVLGGGNGGHAMAAWLSARGLQVRWWMVESEDARHLEAQRALEAEGALEGRFALDLVSDDLGEVLRGTRLAMVVVPANAHEAVARRVAPHLASGATLLLNPGRTGGARIVRRVLRSLRPGLALTVGETESLLLTCRKLDLGRVEILKAKEFGYLATLGAALPEAEQQLLAAVFPQLEQASSTLVTGLTNIGAMLHPAPMLLNVGRIEHVGLAFRHYYDGITPSIARFIERLDDERLEIADAYGVAVPTTLEWHARCYGLRGKTLLETLRLNERYASLYAPEALDHRYLTEDVPTGLVPMIALARVAGLSVPALETTLRMARLVAGEGIMASARTASALGLVGLDDDDVARAFGAA